MEVISRLNEDMLAARCARLLQHLLFIEAETAKGQHWSAQNIQRSDSQHEDDRNELFITVPYFGTIRISPEGIRSMETAKLSTQHMQKFGGHITIGGVGSVHVANDVLTNDSDKPHANVADVLSMMWTLAIFRLCLKSRHNHLLKSYILSPLLRNFLMQISDTISYRRKIYTLM
jgi:hypothetical protein